MTRPGPLLKFSRNPLETGSDLLTYASLLEGSEPLSWEVIYFYATLEHPRIC